MNVAKRYKISTLEKNMYVEDFFLLKRCECRQTKSQPPSHYLDIVLSDQSGEINAKLWDCSDLDIADFDGSKNIVVKVKGTVIIYRDELQLKLDVIQHPEPHERIHVSEFVPSAPLHPADMVEEVYQYANKINHPDIQVIVTTILDEKKDDFWKYPAAKSIHHAIYGGLAYHTITMLKIANHLCEVYPSLNRDLLFAGVILHDLCKIDEFEDEFASDYSIQGQLIGHITMMANLIHEKAKELKISGEIPILLQHMVLTHHGHLEYGSPIQPKLKEAEILHYIDMIDSRMNAMDTAIEKANPKDIFTAPVKALGNRKLYKGLTQK